MKDVLIFSSNCANLQYCGEILVELKSRWKLLLILEDAKLSLCWQNTFIGQNSRSSNREVTKRKSWVSNWKSIRVIQLLRFHKMTKIWTPSLLVRTCSILVILPPPAANVQNFTSPPSFHYHDYSIAKSCYFIDSWTPVIISTYKCHKKYSPDMNVPRVLINTNGVYY